MILSDAQNGSVHAKHNTVITPTGVKYSEHLPPGKHYSNFYVSDNNLLCVALFL